MIGNQGYQGCQSRDGKESLYALDVKVKGEASSPPINSTYQRYVLFFYRESNSEGLRRKAKQFGELFCRRKDGHTGTAGRCGRMSNRMRSILNSPHLHQ